jgi:hypothetical protein
MKRRGKAAFLTTPAGFEHPSLALSKSPISQELCAKSAARRAPSHYLDDELIEITEIWPQLPVYIKAAIQALIETSRDKRKDRIEQ